MAKKELMNKQNSKKKKHRILKDIIKMKSIAVLLWPYARLHKGLLVAGIGLTFLVIGFQLALPWPLKWIIDLIVDKYEVLPALQWIGDTNVIIIVLCGLYIFFAVSRAVAEYGQRLLLAGLGNRMLAKFRLDIFSHILKQSLAFHEKRDIGELLTRVVYDTARLRRGVRAILTRTFQTVLLFIFMIIVLFFLDARLALILAFSGVVGFLLMGKSGSRIFKEAKIQRKREGKLAAVVAEDLLGIREFQTFLPGEVSDRRFKKQNAKSLKEEQKVRRIALGLLLRIEVLMVVSITLILWLGSQAVIAGQFSIGELILFFSYARGLLGPFRRFARQTALTGRTLACADRLIKIVKKDPSIKDLPDAISVSSLNGDISFENISYKSPRARRGGRKWILKDVSLQIKAGERVAILGPNGAGKSSLIRLLLRFSEPKIGNIFLDRRAINEYTLMSLRKEMSVVFQESVFFGLTLRENIAMGRSDATLEEIKNAACRAQISDMIEKLKKGYDTPVFRQGGLFSGGEKQRIAIARALLRDGNIWLLDEPTSALDAEASDALTKLLLEVTEGHTTLWVTHDFRILSQVNRILLLDKGYVHFTGTPEEFENWLHQNKINRVNKKYMKELKKEI